MSLQIILHENYTVVLDKNDKETKTAFIAGWGTLYQDSINKVTIPFEYLKNTRVYIIRTLNVPQLMRDQKSLNLVAPAFFTQVA